MLLLCGLHAHAQVPTPAPLQSRSILITGGTVHVGDGKVIDEGAVGFRGGRIDYVGFDYGVKAQYDTVINAKGQHLYPGFIVPDSPLGLIEVEQTRATVDLRDVGQYEPELRSISAYKSDSRVTPTIRSNGVLLAQVAPRGLTIAGTSSVVQLDAWDNDGATVKADDGVFMTWPSAYQRQGWWAEPGETDSEKKDERVKKLEELRQFFRRVKAYAAEKSPAIIDVRMEAMRGLFDGSKALFVRADAAREITEAVQFAKAEGVQRTVIVGGYDAWRVADLLRDNKVDVVLRRTHSLPMRPEDDVDMPYKLPALLKERGIRFCLGYTGDHEHAGGRNLPFTAGTARAHGLSSEDALRAITLDAAAILGLDQRCGSLALGKDATLIVSQGDALDMRGNDVRWAFIQGRRIVLDDHQKQLYRQYQGKLEKGQ
ncbi:MAG: amidohydrolase family protein [Flavobacteriales bacterium]|nr:amidohydrolase family protein [Flavobacteriales bacterium]